MPKGIEIERKYIIRTPDLRELSVFPGYTVSRITQTYLLTSDGSTHRVRKREYDDRVIYTETKKIRIDEMSVEEREREISEGEYIALLQNARTDSRPLSKTRHTIDYMGHTIEIDVYPPWSRYCIMETELESRDEEVAFPSVICIYREVTGDKSYSNAAMAKRFPPEPI